MRAFLLIGAAFLSGLGLAGCVQQTAPTKVIVVAPEPVAKTENVKKTDTLKLSPDGKPGGKTKTQKGPVTISDDEPSLQLKVKGTEVTP